MSDSSDGDYDVVFVEVDNKTRVGEENVNDKFGFEGQTGVTDEMEHLSFRRTENGEEQFYDVKNKVILKQYVLKK